MGGAQPLAATMNGAAALIIEVDRAAHRAAAGHALPRRSDRRASTRRWRASTSGGAIGVARSIALEGNAADILPELVRRDVVPDVLTDQTSAHDALNGYVPGGMSLAEALRLRERDPQQYIERSMHRWHATWTRCSR